MTKLPYVIDNRPVQGNFDALVKVEDAQDGQLDVHEGRLDVLEDVPRFRVYRSAALSLANNTVVVWDAEEEDSHSWHSTATGIFTPQRAGRYRFSWAVRANVALTADAFLIGILQKNSASVRLGQITYQRGTAPANSLGTAQLDANGTTDTFNILLSHSNGGSLALNVGDALDMWFDGEFIG